jgi:hypothetical protein
VLRGDTRTPTRSRNSEPTKITRADASYVTITYDAALRIDTETHYNAADQMIDAHD